MSASNVPLTYYGEREFLLWLQSLNYYKLNQVVSWLLILKLDDDFLDFEKDLFSHWFKNSLEINLPAEIVKKRFLVAQALNHLFLGARMKLCPFQYLLEILPKLNDFLNKSLVLNFKRQAAMRADIFQNVIALPRFLKHPLAGVCQPSCHAFGRYCERFCWHDSNAKLKSVRKTFIKDFMAAKQVTLVGPLVVRRIIDSNFEKALYFQNEEKNARFVVNEAIEKDEDGKEYRVILTVESPKENKVAYRWY